MLAAELTRLDAAYRARRVRLQAGTSLYISRLFSRLTPEDIIAPRSSAVDEWLDRSIAMSFAIRDQMALEAIDYHNEVRSLVAPGVAPFSFERIPEPPREQVATSLFVQGVVGFRKRVEAAPLAPGSAQAFDSSLIDKLLARQAADPSPAGHAERQLEILRLGSTQQITEALQKSADGAGAAGARHALDGEREQIVEMAKADPRAIGYVRITNGKPCYFCAVLASRGPVYEQDSFKESDAMFVGPGTEKVHDHCSCGLRAVFSRNPAETPEFNQQQQKRWMELRDENGGSLDLATWRQHYEGRATSR